MQDHEPGAGAPAERCAARRERRRARGIHARKSVSSVPRNTEASALNVDSWPGVYRGTSLIKDIPNTQDDEPGARAPAERCAPRRERQRALHVPHQQGASPGVLSLLSHAM